jgi:Tfp pilus assembly protein PilF
MTNVSVSGTWTKLAALAVSAGLLFVPICSALGSAAVVSFSTEKQNDAREPHLERGLQLVQEGDLNSAAAELRSALRLQPENAEVLTSLATVLAMEKQFPESTSLFEKALQISPGDLRSREYLAANLWQLHRYAEAKQNLRIILRADPADSQAKLLLGMVSENSGDYVTAIAMLTSVPDLVRGHPEAILALAKSYYRTGEPGKAAACLRALGDGGGLGNQSILLGIQVAGEMQDYSTAEELLSKIPSDSADSVTARYRLAVARFQAKQYEDSERILEQLIGDGQKSGKILRLLGWCYHYRNRNEDMIRTFREAIQLDPTDQANFLDLGALLLADRRFGPAVELAKRTVNAFPDSSEALRLLGSTELATEQFTDAAKTYSRSLTLDPKSTEGILGLAKAQIVAGMDKQAKTTLEAAIRQSPGTAVLELELALVLLKEKEGAIESGSSDLRAEQLLQAAAKHDPTLAEAQSQLGEMALRRGQTGLAIAHLQKAVQISPESRQAHFSLARAYRRTGRNDEAAKETALFEQLKEKESSRATPPPPATLSNE